jgi:hypothetical protein
MADKDTHTFEIENTPRGMPGAPALVSEIIRINVTNKSHKDVEKGSVAVQNAASGDTQTPQFGYIRALGGVAYASVYLNGRANTIVAQFFAPDGSDWKGISGDAVGKLNIDINLNDHP